MQSLKKKQRSLYLENPWPQEANIALDPYKWRKAGQAAPERAGLTVVICLPHTQLCGLAAPCHTAGNDCQNPHTGQVKFGAPQPAWDCLLYNKAFDGWLDFSRQLASLTILGHFQSSFRKKEVLLVVICQVKKWSAGGGGDVIFLRNPWRNSGPVVTSNVSVPSRSLSGGISAVN